MFNLRPDVNLFTSTFNDLLKKINSYIRSLQVLLGENFVLKSIKKYSQAFFSQLISERGDSWWVQYTTTLYQTDNCERYGRELKILMVSSA